MVLSYVCLYGGVMLNKKTMVAAALEKDIGHGIILPGEMIPSRAQLMRRFNCSRTVVERAVAELTLRGVLAGKQGKGTFVTGAGIPQNIVPIQRIFAISSYYAKSFRQPFTCLLLDSSDLGLPVEFIPNDRADAEAERLCQPDALNIFINSGYEELPVMHYLKSRHIPMLVINREFDGFDRIYTDILAGFRAGVEFLENSSDAPLYVIGRTAQLKYPYQSFRQMNFFRACAEHSVTVYPENIFILPFENIAEDMKTLRNVFRRSPCRVAVLNSDLSQPVIDLAVAENREPGKDFFMLGFEYLADLADIPGVAMIRQKYDVFYEELKSFIANYGKCEYASLNSAIPPELIVCGK